MKYRHHKDDSLKFVLVFERVDFEKPKKKIS